MFKPRFARLVEAHTKRQTFRPIPKRMPQPGDIIDCREWSGKPYRSPQTKLIEATITNVVRALITESGIAFEISEGKWVIGSEETIAIADGFKDWPEMRDWFKAQHGLPVDCILIQWQP